MAFDGIVESIDPILVPTLAPLEHPMDVQEWPWPRLLVTSNRVLLLVKQQNGRLYAFEMFLDSFKSWIGYAVADLGTADAIHFVDIADFGLYYILSVVSQSDTRMFVRNPLLNNDTVDRDIFGVNLVDETVQPVAATVCNNKGQFLGGNISNWQNLGINGIIWSGIGVYEFDPQVMRTAGFCSLLSNRSDGTVCQIQRLLPLSDGVVCYTNHGNIILPESLVGDTFTYGKDSLRGLGILSGNHVAGDEFYHGFIDLNKEFWTLEPGTRVQKATLQKRGYRDYIKKIFEDDNEVIVSYIPLLRQFYISNGNHSLVINNHGAFTCYQGVSSALVGWDGNIHGTFREINDRSAIVVVDATDFGSRGLKTLESVEVGANCAYGTVLHGSTLWKSKKDDNYKLSRPIVTNPLGEARLCVTALDYKIKVTFSNFEGSELSSLSANVKYPDARFRRGVAAAQQAET